MIAKKTTLHQRPKLNNLTMSKVHTAQSAINDNVKQFKREKKQTNLCTKNEQKQIYVMYVTHQQMTTTALKAPDLEQAHTLHCTLIF